MGMDSFPDLIPTPLRDTLPAPDLTLLSATPSSYKYTMFPATARGTIFIDMVIKHGDCRCFFVFVNHKSTAMMFHSCDNLG